MHRIQGNILRWRILLLENYVNTVQLSISSRVLSPCMSTNSTARKKSFHEGQIPIARHKTILWFSKDKQRFPGNRWFGYLKEATLIKMSAPQSSDNLSLSKCKMPIPMKQSNRGVTRQRNITKISAKSPAVKNFLFWRNHGNYDMRHLNFHLEMKGESLWDVKISI